MFSAHGWLQDFELRRALPQGSIRHASLVVCETCCIRTPRFWGALESARMSLANILGNHAVYRFSWALYRNGQSPGRSAESRPMVYKIV